jgi:redox-sensitive bicupin YhaK (pirin superfamily)
MTKIIRSQERFHAESDWLSTYWLFSFDRYYDPNNVQFGPLRVFNDDVIQPAGGFGTHPHREMEIVTYVLKGALSHKDSTGGRDVIKAGEVQRMTAGTGIAHSEYNASDKDAVHLLQMWVLPAEEGLKPSYEQKQFTEEQRTGVLLPIASGQQKGDAVKVHQDVTFYVSKVRPEDRINHDLAPGRRTYLYVIDGDVAVNDYKLSAGDQARITDETRLEISSSKPSEIILIDLP